MWKEALWLISRHFPCSRLNERRDATESFGQGSRYLVRDSNLDPSKMRNNNNGTSCEMEANLYGEISCCNDLTKRNLNVPLRPSSVWDAVRRRCVAGYRRYIAISVAETSLNNYSVCRATSQKSEGVTAPSRKPEI
jgi:hypothetical protein